MAFLRSNNLAPDPRSLLWLVASFTAGRRKARRLGSVFLKWPNDFKFIQESSASFLRYSLTISIHVINPSSHYHSAYLIKLIESLLFNSLEKRFYLMNHEKKDVFYDVLKDPILYTTIHLHLLNSFICLTAMKRRMPYTNCHICLTTI